MTDAHDPRATVQPTTDATQPRTRQVSGQVTQQATRDLTRRDLMLLAGATVGTVVGTLATGGPAWAQAGPKRGGVLKVSANANPSSLDPATGGAGSDHTFLWTLYDTLVEWDYDTLKTKPGLAAFTFPDPRTMVLDIKPGISFHDGSVLDAVAVKFNLDRGRQDARSNIKADLSSVAEVIVELSTEVLTLKNGRGAS